MARNGPADDTTIYEFRFYEVAAGRLAAEVARMYDVAIAGEPEEAGGPPAKAQSMFDRYGVPRPIGAWTGIAGRRQPQFGYILRWDSLKQRDASFPPFWADPLWQKIRAATDAGVPMVERIEDWLLRPNPSWDACASRSAGETPPGQLTEMLIQRVENGFMAPATQAHAEVTLPVLLDRGAVLLGVFDVIVGPDTPAMVTFLAWPDHETQQAAWQAHHLDAGVRQRIRDERRQYGHPLVRSNEHQTLQPVSYGVPAANFGRKMA